MFRYVFSFLISAAVAMPIYAGATDSLPNQPARPIEDSDGVRMLSNWSVASVTSPHMKRRELPENPAFKGSEIWLMDVDEKPFDAVTKRTFFSAGMQDVSLLASARCNPNAVAVLDSDDQAHCYAVMVSGKLSDKDARGIALILYGSLDGSPMSSTVHAFMAPKANYEALGGFAIIAAKWLEASAAPDENMLLEGRLEPQAAVNRLSLFFSAWVEHHVIPMMAMSMQMEAQSIQQMQSWNSAMNACGADPSCSVSPLSDGSGNWEPSWK
jgi:hypothetical protein